MSKISGYLTLNNPLGDDILIGTDIHNSNITKNFSIQSLFNIGLDLTTSKINIYDSTIENYGEITLDDDVFRVKGAPANTRNLLVSSAAGYLSFKKNNYDVKLDATAITDSRTYTLQNTNGTVALVETTSLQQVTDNGDTTTNEIFIPKLNLFDSVSEGYASIQCIDSEWSFENAANQSVFGINPGGITLKNNSSTYYGNISPQLITSYTNYSLPNKSGTFALTNDLRPYKVFTALLTQTGGSDSQATYVGPSYGGNLTIGISYTIADNGVTADFTNVGAPNNNVGTIFIATGTVPADRGDDNTYLTFDGGAPVATILENTIGNIWFTYNDAGEYYINSSELFYLNKIYNSVTNNIDVYNFGNFQSITIDQASIAQLFLATGNVEGHYNDILRSTPIEIRVYN